MHEIHPDIDDLSFSSGDSSGTGQNDNDKERVEVPGPDGGVW